MVTGRLPFDSHDPYEILRKHIREPMIPPVKVNPACPPDLNELVLRCCAKDPKDRYANAQQIVDFLAKHMKKPGEGFDPNRQRSKTLTIIYENDQDTRQRVEDAVRAFVRGARKVPGVTIGYGDIQFN